MNRNETFFTHTLGNGLTLLGQPMPQVSSAAMTILLPLGVARDPQGSEGATSVLSEWMFRGAGEFNSRQLNDVLDAMGSQHHETASTMHLSLGASLLGRNLPELMRIYADLVRRPRFEEETFAPCRELTLQDLLSLEDEPAKKAVTLLREHFYPHPLGRCVYGTAESLQTMTPDGVREYYRQTATPHGMILAVAGSFDWDAFCRLAESLFGDWTAPPAPTVNTQPQTSRVTHLEKDSAQTHITLAHKSVPFDHPQYYAARLAETVLSGGMSSRLFTEVREKRGLVYHVSTRYHSLKEHAGLFTYAGTTPAKAQETFDVTVGELRRLGEGITEEELARARVQLKSGQVMQGESTEARSGAIAGDYYRLGRLRGLQELCDAIDAVTLDDVMAYLSAFPAKNFTVLTIGPAPVNTSRMDD